MLAAKSAKYQAFNFAKENEIFQNIIGYWERYRYDNSQSKLGFTESSWHKQWVHNKPQVRAVCKTDGLLLGEIENEIIYNKSQDQHRTKRDKSLTEDSVATIVNKVRSMGQKDAEVILLKARKIPMSRITQQFPTLRPAQINQVYYDFVRFISQTTDFEYLRFMRGPNKRVSLKRRGVKLLKKSRKPKK